jgi:hypothetical protein
MTRTPFQFNFLFSILIFQASEKSIGKEYIGISEKCETLRGDRFEYLPQLLYWLLGPKVDHIQIKNRFWIGV